MQLGFRILKFFEFIYQQDWSGSICWFEKEFHVTITCDGNVYSYGQAPTLTGALNLCLEGIKKGGF